MIYPHIVVILIVYAKRANGQSSSVYSCVLPQYCPNGILNTPSIDPRIITPVSGGVDTNIYLCPVGQAACYGQGRDSTCGVVTASPVNTNSGPASPGAHPWQAYITVDDLYIGSGMLLNNYHVLTAAHKVASNVDTPENIKVYFGVFNPAEMTDIRDSLVEKILLASDYDAATLKNDIAVLKLSAPMPLGVYDEINTGCLPAEEDYFVGENCIVAGWGQTAFTTIDAPTNPMKQVVVPIVQWSTCRGSYSNETLLGNNVDTYLDMNEICAGGEPQKDACTQDGGAPLMCFRNGRYYSAGLVIWGKNCGLSGVYGVYVSVPAYKARIDAAIISLNTNVDIDSF